MLNKETPEETAGVDMMIALQTFVGIDQPREPALKAWRQFGAWEKERTRECYEHLKAGTLQYFPRQN